MYQTLNRLKNSFVAGFTLINQKALIVLSGLFFVFSCSVRPITPTHVSSLDTNYKFKKLAAEKNEAESALVTVYQKALRRGLYSQCEYFPSDSVYSQVMSKRCGTGASLVKTFDRFVREPDASYLGIPMLSTDHGQSYRHLPDSCELF